MSVSSIDIKRNIAPLGEGKGINIFTGGRETVEYVELNTEEEDAIEAVVMMGYHLLSKISPSIAKEWLDHKEIFIKFGGVAKGKFPGQKPIKFPSEVGSIGVNILIPQALKYAATPSSSSPCYTSYTTNSWNLNLTAGTPVYFLGDGTNYYKASPETEAHSLIVIMQNGLIEIGSTPKIDQFQLKTEIMTKYGVWSPPPLVELPVEPNKPIHQYPTLGVLPCYHDLGVMFGGMPKVNGTAKIAILGLVFYEHNFMSTLKYVS